MNKSNGGKQQRQHDTIIPQSNPNVTKQGLVQKMTTDLGLQKGLKTVLEERGFNISGLKTKCAPVCPFESSNCFMERLLSQQEDFVNQVSMLEMVITDACHLCLFLPKFHCELNPIEMVCIYFTSSCSSLLHYSSTGAGASIDIVKCRSQTLLQPSKLLSIYWIRVLLKSCIISSTGRFNLWVHIVLDWPGRQQSGQYANRNNTTQFQGRRWWRLRQYWPDYVHKSFENFAEKIGTAKTSWEKLRTTVFGLLLAVRVEICPRFVPKNSPSQVIKFVVFACPQL